jgi:hypothetical protein
MENVSGSRGINGLWRTLRERLVSASPRMTTEGVDRAGNEVRLDTGLTVRVCRCATITSVQHPTSRVTNECRSRPGRRGLRVMVSHERQA